MGKAVEAALTATRCVPSSTHPGRIGTDVLSRSSTSEIMPLRSNGWTNQGRGALECRIRPAASVTDEGEEAWDGHGTAKLGALWEGGRTVSCGLPTGLGALAASVRYAGEHDIVRVSVWADCAVSR